MPLESQYQPNETLIYLASPEASPIEKHLKISTKTTHPPALRLHLVTGFYVTPSTQRVIWC